MSNSKNQNTALATQQADKPPSNVHDLSVMEQVIIGGDLAALQPYERVEYYTKVCTSLGLNPLTKPFEYIVLDGRLTLYPRKDCSDQLRRIHGVSFDKIEKAFNSGLCLVTVYAKDKHGRVDVDMGAVPTEKELGEWKTAGSGKRYFAGTGEFVALRGTDLANAIKKAITQGKRRVTLSICGLGWTDESEIDTIPDAQTVVVDDSGNIVDSAAPAQQPARTAQVYDATGTPVEAPEPVIGEKSETISQLIEELARIKGVAEKKVFDRFCKSYMAAWNTKEMPILIKIPESHFEWCLEQLDTWIQAAQPAVEQNGADVLEAERQAAQSESQPA